MGRKLIHYIFIDLNSMWAVGCTAKSIATNNLLYAMGPK